MRRRKQSPVIVTGPHGERPAVSAGAGLSLAQNLACHHDEGPATFYVRDAVRESVLARVERDDHGVVLTFTV